jgi:hypothetical protein
VIQSLSDALSFIGKSVLASAILGWFLFTLRVFQAQNFTSRWRSECLRRMLQSAVDIRVVRLSESRITIALQRSFAEAPDARSDS